jgi:hypothetical protein
LAGKPVSVPETLADGCAISRAPATAESNATALNYHEHIAPIIEPVDEAAN